MNHDTFETKNKAIISTLNRSKSSENFIFEMLQKSGDKGYSVLRAIEIVEKLELEVWFSIYKPPKECSFSNDNNKTLERFRIELYNIIRFKLTTKRLT